MPPTGLEPATSSLEGKRSNPTELQGLKKTKRNQYKKLTKTKTYFFFLINKDVLES